LTGATPCATAAKVETAGFPAGSNERRAVGEGRSITVSASRDRAWFEAVATRANDDAELKAVGRNFTATISFTIDETRHDLVVQEGRVTAVRDLIKIDSRADFGFRAPSSVWNTFLQKYPTPLYHSVFAMIMRLPEFHVDGDTLVFAQNARALTRLLAIMQSQGAPA
jgi:hypothetical protein